MADRDPISSENLNAVAPMSDRRHFLGGATAVSMLLWVEGCAPGGGTDETAATASTICVDAFLQEAVNLNPLLYADGGAETAVEYTLFDSLWRIGPDDHFIPNLAAEIPDVANGGLSADGLNWRIKLRRDVAWHDGKRFTAADVVFTIGLLMNPAVPVRSRNGQLNVAAISAPDAYTVEIRLKQPFAPYMTALQRTSIVPEHLLAHEPDLMLAAFNSNPVGTGPFKFRQRVAGDRIEFDANRHYHGGTPAISTLIQKYVPDQQTLYAQLETGAVTIFDGKGISAERVAAARVSRTFDVVLTPAPYVEFLYFNLARPQFAEKVVRHAIHHVVDRTSWIDILYYGLPRETLSYLPADHWAYNPHLTAPPFDPAIAADMLERAGWRKGSDGVRAKDGVRLAFECATLAGDKSREQAQLVLQQNLAGIGIDMGIRNMPGAIVYGDFTTRSEYDMLLVGWEPYFFPDPDYSQRVGSDAIPALNGAGANYTQYRNPEIDKLCAEGLATFATETRRRIYWKIQEILLDDLPFIPIFSYRSALGVSKRLGGFRPNPNTPCNSWNNASWFVR
jgi:peptide/nickel transport system substrate-binding protein